MHPSQEIKNALGSTHTHKFQNGIHLKTGNIRKKDICSILLLKSAKSTKSSEQEHQLNLCILEGQNGCLEKNANSRCGKTRNNIKDGFDQNNQNQCKAYPSLNIAG